jgi:hypothetical protein
MTSSLFSKKNNTVDGDTAAESNLGGHALTLPRLQRQNAQHAIEVGEPGSGVSILAVPGLTGENNE